MRILIVKLSSLGDVVHTMPAVQDLLHYCPEAQIDWVVEEGFAELAALCKGVQRVIPFGLRRWRKQGLWKSKTRLEWRDFKATLQCDAYDWVFDMQGLIKSACIARLARITANGQRVGLANRTDGSSYEALARLAYTRAIAVPARTHAIERSRQLVARALDKPIYSQLSFGIANINKGDSNDTQNSIDENHGLPPLPVPLQTPYAVFVHGSSRDDKLWREASWIKLGAYLCEVRQMQIVLPWGSHAEHEAAKRIAGAISLQSSLSAVVLPRMRLDDLTGIIAHSSLVVGVDSGLVHIASGLNIPTVQLYNFPTSWRTGGYWNRLTVNVEELEDRTGPSDEAVLGAAKKVLEAA